MSKLQSLIISVIDKSILFTSFETGEINHAKLLSCLTEDEMNLISYDTTSDFIKDIRDELINAIITGDTK